MYAVVRGIGVAGGDLPGTRGSEPLGLAIERALEAARIDAATIDYVECDAAGDPHSDGVHLDALRTLPPPHSGRRTLGSLAACAGETGASGGLASLIKAALCLRHTLLPPLTGYRQPRAGLDSDAFHVPQRAQHWLRDRADGPRRAAITTITADGAAACAILEEHARRSGKTPVRVESIVPNERAVHAVYGRDAAELRSSLSSLRKRLEDCDDVSRLARAEAHRGAPGDASLAVSIVAGSAPELRQSIEEASRQLDAHPQRPIAGKFGIYYAPHPLAPRGRLAFVFPGSGNHFLGMGGAIGIEWPHVLHALDAQTQRLRSQLQPERFLPQRVDWSGAWRADAERRMNADVVHTILAQVAYGVV
ncbi:MAG: hypothetical protein D6744_03975, partial [Planctomycetota bacterium]